MAIHTAGKGRAQLSMAKGRAVDSGQSNGFDTHMETERMETKTINEPKVGEFFQLRPDARRGGKGHGVVFENEGIAVAAAAHLEAGRGGFPPLHETPRLVYNPSEGSCRRTWRAASVAIGWSPNGSAK